jgi:hypothetical protein
LPASRTSTAESIDYGQDITNLRGIVRSLAFKMIDELINDFQIDLFERPKRLVQ